MSWKKQLRKLERNKQWDIAIQFMENVIQGNSNDMDAYIYMNYLLMNLLVEENYDKNKSGYYETLAKKYFDESYAKFSHNAEYLFFTGITAAMSEWYFGIDVADYERMLEKAMILDPKSLLYKRTYYINLNEHITDNKKKVTEYATMILNRNSSIRKILEAKGAIGEYLLELMTNWSLGILEHNSYTNLS